MNTPKNFALQLGALITLYASLTSLMVLLFSIINVTLPDAADNYWQIEQASSSIKFSIAMLLVFFPVYLWLTRTMNQIRRNEQGMYLSLTKWLIYLSLLVGGAVLLGDFVAIIYGFLNGELTVRFALKAAVLAIGIGAAFYYYLKDAQGYWQTHEKQSIIFGIGASAVVLLAVIVGFMNSETPADVREMKIDNNQVGDLQDMQWRIEDYYRTNESLPENIEAVYGNLPTPEAPEGRAAYTYVAESDTEYQLCAEFSKDSTRDEYSRAYPISEKNYDWTYLAGTHCFERVIDDLYRP